MMALIQPEQLAAAGTESAHQQALFCWAALNTPQYPELKWLHHIPNGGSRGDTARSRAIAGGQMKAEGVKPGVADVFLPVKRGSWSGLYIEMKRPSLRPQRAGSKGGLSDEQIEFGEFVKSQGFGFAVGYSWDSARDLILAYLAI